MVMEARESRRLRRESGDEMFSERGEPEGFSGLLLLDMVTLFTDGDGDVVVIPRSSLSELRGEQQCVNACSRCEIRNTEVHLALAREQYA